MMEIPDGSSEASSTSEKLGREEAERGYHPDSSVDRENQVADRGHIGKIYVG